MRSQRRKLAKINFPGVFAGVEIDRVERAPRRRDRGIAIGIEKPSIAGEAIFHVGGRWLSAGDFFLWRAGQEIHELLDLIFGEAGKSIHAALAGANRTRDLRRRQAIADIHEGRKRRRRTFEAVAVTDRALRQVNRFRRVAGLVFTERSHPRHFVGVDVENVGIGIEGGAAPLRAAVEAGKNHGFLADAERRELAFAARFVKLIERPFVHFGRAIGQHLFSEHLPRVRRGFRGQRLLDGGDFAGNCARGIFFRFEWKERRAGGAIEKIDEALLAGLRDGFDFLTVALNVYEHRMRRKIAVPDVVMHRLEMPDALAGVRVEREQAIREEIVAEAVAAVEIECRRAGRHEHDAALHIDGHAGPVVRGADRFLGIGRPGVVAELAGMRNGVERPAHFAGAHVEGADIAGRRGQRLGISPAGDEHVFINHDGAGQRNERIGIFSAQIVAEIDAAVCAKARDRFSRGRVQRIDEIHDADDDALVGSSSLAQ